MMLAFLFLKRYIKYFFRLVLLFEKDFPKVAAERYEQNDKFFKKLFDDPDMMQQVMYTIGNVLYERLRQ